THMNTIRLHYTGQAHTADPIEPPTITVNHSRNAFSRKPQHQEPPGPPTRTPDRLQAAEGQRSLVPRLGHPVHNRRLPGTRIRRALVTQHSGLTHGVRPCRMSSTSTAGSPVTFTTRHGGIPCATARQIMRSTSPHATPRCRVAHTRSASPTTTSPATPETRASSDKPTSTSFLDGTETGGVARRAKGR